jgi:hypothetical protein
VKTNTKGRGKEREVRSRRSEVRIKEKGKISSKLNAESSKD